MTGQLSVYGPNPRYLQDATGRPVVLIGFGNEGRNPPAVLDQLQGKINYTRVYAAWWGRQQEPNAYHGGRPWPMVNGQADLDTWNETYWANLRAYMESARDRNLMVGLTIWDGHSDLPGGQFGAESIWNAHHNRQGVQWAYDEAALRNFPNPDPNSPEARERLVYYQRRFVDRLIEEIKSYPNVLIELNNEEPSGHEAWFLYWAAYFKTRTGFVIAVNDAGSGGALTDATFARAADVDMKSYHFRTADTITATRLAFDKVIVADADDSCGNMDPTAARRVAWSALVKGGHWNDFVCYDENYPDQTKLDDYGRLLDFLRASNLPFWTMSPRPDLVTGGLALVNVGSHYLAYRPAGGATDVDLSGVGGSFTVQWYNPRTGEFVARGATEGGAVRTFVAPDKNDWVLHLYRADASLHLYLPLIEVAWRACEARRVADFRGASPQPGMYFCLPGLSLLK